MKIAIDIDDTLTNTKELQLIYWKEYYNKNPKEGYSTEIPKHINDFGDDYVQEFWDTYRQILMFECSFKDNVSTVLKKLVAEGHDLQILSARQTEKWQNLHEKISTWFKENDIPIQKLNLGVREKAKFARVNSFDIMIDDNIVECNKGLELGINAILFNKNDSYEGFQTTDWNEVYNYIKSAKYHK